MNNNNNKGYTMKQLILKGLGKAKVKRIIRNFMIEQFNIHLEYYANTGESFSLPLYCTIEGHGLPEVDCDDPFTFGELVEYVGNKI